MDGSVQELTDKTEKLAINPEIPKYPTNWCHLPAEMQFECIKWMDFKTRTRLGATSHTEKSLVEAKKYHFDRVRLEHYSCYNLLLGSSGVLTIDAISSFDNVHLETFNNHEKTLNCLVNILKNCQIDTFEFSELNVWSELLDFWPEIEKCAPFRFKTFKYSGDASTAAILFLRNCEGVENIVLNSYDDYNYKLSDFINLPAVFNAKLVRFEFFDKRDRGVHQLVQKWIDNQSEIGNSLQVVHEFAEFVDSFASEFKDRVIYRNDDEVRIRTNDESKHILMSCDKIGQFLNVCSCTINSSNLLESEYRKIINELVNKKL